MRSETSCICGVRPLMSRYLMRWLFLWLSQNLVKEFVVGRWERLHSFVCVWSSTVSSSSKSNPADWFGDSAGRLAREKGAWCVVVPFWCLMVVLKKLGAADPSDRFFHASSILI